MSALNRRMSDRHEADLADLLGGRVSPGSGNQWNRPMDVRQSRFIASMAFAVEGKSTLGKSIGVTREMWDKAVEQAGGERPLLALRWYADDRLSGVDIDLIVAEAEDFAELLGAAEAKAQLDALIGELQSRLDRYEHGHDMVDSIIGALEDAGLGDRVPIHTRSPHDPIRCRAEGHDH